MKNDKKLLLREKEIEELKAKLEEVERVSAGVEGYRIHYGRAAL